MTQSPSVEQIRIKNVAATFVLLEWDDVGGMFTYEIQKSANGGAYFLADFSGTPDFFDRNATPNTTYTYRVRVVSSDYSPSEWAYSDQFVTYETNSYAVISQSSVSIYNNFINRKLTHFDDFINFNRDQIQTSLIREGYQFSNSHTNITDVEAFKLYSDETLKIYGDVSAACGDKKNLMPAIFNGYLFMFERFQSIVRYSTNLGQSWKTHSGIPGRVGSPVGNQIAATTDSAMYVIGYDGIYALTFNTGIHWSATTVKFGNIDETFVADGVSGFRFTKLVSLPSGVPQGSVEAICVSDDGNMLYIAASDTIYCLNLQASASDEDGNRIWDSRSFSITGNVTTKIKNLVPFGDSVYAYGYTFDDWMSINAYVIVLDDLGSQTTPTITVKYPSGENIVYTPEEWLVINSNSVVMNTSTQAPPERDEGGVYRIKYDLSSSVRVYGNTPAERNLLDPFISNLSRSLNYLCIDTMHRSYEIVDSNGELEDPTPGYTDDEVDPERVDYASRYQVDPAIVTTMVRPYRQPLKSFDGINWRGEEENYHYECQYIWFSGYRVWINYKEKLCVIEPKMEYDHVLTNTSEVLDRGTYTFYADSFNITKYPGYTTGMVFYRKDTGDLIGFYNLGYRTRDNAIFTWVPDRVVLTAALASNEIDVIEPEPEPDSADDIVPPLEPMVYQFLPSHFIQSEPLYVEFVEEYLKFLSSDYTSDYGQLHGLLRNHDVNETMYMDMFHTDLSKRNVYLEKDKWTELLKFSRNNAFDIYSIKGIKDAYTFLFKYLYNEDVIISTEGDTKYEFDIIIDSVNLTTDLVGNRIYTSSRSGQADVVYYERWFETDGRPFWKVTLNNIIGEFVVGDTLQSDVDKQFTAAVHRGVVGKEKPLNNEDYLQRGPTYYAISVQSKLQVSKYRDDVIRFVHPVGFGFVGIMLLSMFINSGVSASHRETIIERMQTLKWDMGLPRVYPDEIPNLNVDGSYKRDKYGVIQYKPHPLAGQPFPVTPNYLVDNPTVVSGKNAIERRKESFLFDSSNMRFIENKKIVKGRLKDGISQRKDS